MKRGIPVFILIILCNFAIATICDNPEPEWLWCDDFETGNYQSRYDDYDDRGDFQLSSDAYSGSYSYEMRYSAGQVDSAYLGWWFCDRWSGITEPCQDEIYYRWYHKYEAGFQGMPEKMARVRRSTPNQWTPTQYGAMFWVIDDVVVADLIASSGWLPITHSSHYVADTFGEWVCYEAYVRAGRNGAVIYWADDQEILNKPSVDFGTNDPLNVIMLDTYWNEGSPKAQSRFFDEFVISTERIGCLQSGNVCDTEEIRCVGAGREYTTIQSAVDVAAAGDEIIVYDGTYNEDVSIGNSGTSTDKINIHSDTKHGAIVKSFDVNGDYNIVKDFRIENPSDASCIEVDGNNNEILGNHLDQCKRYGAWVSGDNNLVMDNYLFKPQMGFTVLGTDNIIDSNEVDGLHNYGVLGDCDYTRFFGSGHIFRNNLFHNMERAEVGTAHVDCFQTFDNNQDYAVDMWFINNTCYSFSQALMLEASFYEQSHDLHIIGNVFAHGGAWIISAHEIDNIEVIGNTFAFSGIHGIGFRDDSLGNIVKNNIFYDTGTSYWTADTSTMTPDYNLVFNANDPSTIGPHDIIGEDPLFADAANDDFHLLDGSPACTGGEGGTYIGAFPCIVYVPPVKCTDADTNSNGVIDNAELLAFIDSWKLGSIQITALLDAISKWKTGC